MFTNPAGMTRLERAQLLGAGQVLWANTKFSIDESTSTALGSDDGGFVTASPGGSWAGEAF